MNDSLLLPQVATTLNKHKMEYEVLECTTDLADTAAFCQHYGISLQQSANTILVASRKVEPVTYAVCVVLATTKLDVNKAVCKLLGVKKASFADADTTVQLTGMQIGGVTAVGITDLPIYIDQAVMEQPEVVLGGGNRTSKLRLNPIQLRKLPNAQVVPELASTRV